MHTGDKVERTFDIWATFGRQKLPTFNKVDRVEHVQLWRQCLPRQNGDKSVTKSKVVSTFDFVTMCTGPNSTFLALIFHDRRKKSRFRLATLSLIKLIHETLNDIDIFT